MIDLLNLFQEPKKLCFLQTFEKIIVHISFSKKLEKLYFLTCQYTLVKPGLVETKQRKSKVKVYFYLDCVRLEISEGSQILLTMGVLDLGTYFYTMQLPNPLIQLEICDC